MATDTLTAINMDDIKLEGQIETGGAKAGTSTKPIATEVPPQTKSAFGMFSTVPSFDSLKPNEWISKRRESLKPWTEFMNTSRFKKPNGVAECGKRLIGNISHFQSNYLFVFVFLAIYCILTSPFLLFAFMAVAVGFYMLHLKFKDSNNNITIFGKELSRAQLYTTTGIVAIPIFLIAGAGSAVFWIIGASLCLIVGHALFYAREDQDPFQLQMNVV